MCNIVRHFSILSNIVPYCPISSSIVGLSLTLSNSFQICTMLSDIVGLSVFFKYCKILSNIVFSNMVRYWSILSDYLLYNIKLFQMSSFLSDMIEILLLSDLIQYCLILLNSIYFSCFSVNCNVILNDFAQTYLILSNIVQSASISINVIWYILCKSHC